MAENLGRGMFFGPGKEEGNEGQRIIFVLVNRLSLFLKTKREVNRAVDEIRYLLRRRVKQRQRARADSNIQRPSPCGDRPPVEDRPSTFQH